MGYRGQFGSVFCAIFVLSVSAAAVLGQNAPTDVSAMTDNGDGALPSHSETTADPSQDARCCDLELGQPYHARWTASANFIMLDRVGGVNQTLVETVPRSESPSNPGTEVLNANDFHQGFAGGPRLGLIRHGDNGYDLELSYFQIDEWSCLRSVGPDPTNWLVMTAPGGFLQTQDHFDTQSMTWNYASRLYNAELNVRRKYCDRITLLAGFRWVNLGENLQGTLPPERVTPFWDNTTTNNLYGFQIGADAKLFERGRFSISGLAKAGIYDNNASETSGVSIYRTVYWESASTDHAAFLGELGLRCKYRVTQRLSLNVGYEVMWLEGVALAPAQIAETNSHIVSPVSVQATGLDCNSGVFYHGATVGLEYVF